MSDSATADVTFRSVRVYTATEAARLLGVTRQSVLARLNRGTLRGWGPKHPQNVLDNTWVVDAGEVEHEAGTAGGWFEMRLVPHDEASAFDELSRGFDRAETLDALRAARDSERERRERAEAELDAERARGRVEVARLQAALAAMVGAAPVAGPT